MVREPYITIKCKEIKPNEKIWNYPLEEIPYLMNQIEDGDRENGYEFILFDGRLYESEETEIM